MNDSCESDWGKLLSGGERAQMLQDIAEVGLTVGQHLFTDNRRDDLDITAGSLRTRKSPVERLGFIAGTLPALTQTVEQIACAPLTVARPQGRRVAPPERARRLDTQALLHSVRRGEAARVAVEIETAVSLDTPENRTVRAFLCILQGDAKTIKRMAEAAGETGVADAAGSCARRLRGLVCRLDEDRAAGGDSAAWTTPPTHRMLAHPAYARMAGWMRRYRQDFGFDWDTPLFRLPARETWRLYEVWGLFQVLRALRALGFTPSSAEAESGPALFGVRQDRLLFRLTKGESSGVTLRSPRGGVLRLSYSRAYPARQRSLSRTMQPDITLENGAGDAWILDPKFKAFAAPGDEGGDIDQMHAYRDAIVDAQGVRSVRRAWCLFAGGTGGAPRPCIAYGPPASSVVGALCLRPGDADGFGRLCNLLAAWGVT